MNLTELARILKITPQELRDLLPQLGFHIGQKAIKVDDRTAQRIIKEWPFLIRQIGAKKQLAAKEEEKIRQTQIKKEIKIPSFVAVRDFALLAGLPVSKVLAELMKNGIFASVNERIDFDTAWLVGSNMGLEVKLEAGAAEGEAEKKDADKLKRILEQEKKENLISRPPVVVVMGHVDHGKTKLLDAIRHTDVVAGEAGGITQHIGAYQVKRKDKTITFIDTPGHEAFTAMRGRGAKVADVAILVVAADDGVKPQTVEAYGIIKAAKIPFLVVINKMDKPEANIDKTKQELSTQLNIVPEDWGGKTVCAPISAKEGKGIEELLDILLLLAETESETLKANPAAPAVGTVIESRVSKGEGPVATILIQNGTLKAGNQLVFDGKIYGKVRALKNHKGEIMSEAAPSMPVKIIGLKITPQVGDILEVGSGERIKGKIIKPAAIGAAKTEIAEAEDVNVKKINLIIKSDVLGSAGAIEESLEKISSPEIKIKIIYKGLGNATEGDVTCDETSAAQLICFNVKVPPQIEVLAKEKNVTVKIYNVIYHLINDVKKQMQELVEPEIKRADLGKLKVLAIFKTESKSQIVGGKVSEGKIETESFIEVIRDDKIIERGKLTRLQSGKQDVKSVEAGQECGIQYEGRAVIEVGDELRFYKEEKVIKKI
ncbi:translation initiation factor IF-2 [Candidatus Falkowbacteria bacterium]|nr:translation initiation factor IF-2 [Candidatus Falkowbacteria bacterium]